MPTLYCERLAAALSAEPINVSSNLAFFVAAGMSWKLARRARTPSTGAWLLICLMAAIGTGSTLFHALGTRWAEVLDALPIILFQLTFLWLYVRAVIEVPRSHAFALLGAFLVAMYWARQLPQVLNGSLFYAPALLTISALGWYHYRAHKNARGALPAAVGLFVVAIFFRSIDSVVCGAFPHGTHFLWHMLTPVALYLFMRGLIWNLDGEGAAGGDSGRMIGTELAS